MPNLNPSIRPGHACPVCGHSSHVEFLCTVAPYSIYRCFFCHSDHVFPTPDAATLKTYYDRADWFEAGETGGYRNYDEQTAWSVDLVKGILDGFGEMAGLSVLDIGCGYGTHLAQAAQRDWKCFGVELSDHARTVAKERLDTSAYLVENVSDLIPHAFDLILMLDVLEHLPSPYPLLYQLFSLGAITERTRIVITTPNADSKEALADPAAWSYRHPPSHLVYYSAEALNLFLQRLHFRSIEINGLHGSKGESDLTLCPGLIVTASGSDFVEFMHERYVPGTWSRIARYEHIPRYALSRSLAAGKKVLDFGCGTGYGTLMLATSATEVVGLDIDADALTWANDSNGKDNIRYHLCSDLGATLPEASFDLICCFEMIEHVDFATQQNTIANISRLLQENGLLLISTPNPEVTSHYGANPYHIREMSETEFTDLLGTEFPHVRIFKQRVLNGIVFNGEDANPALKLQWLADQSDYSTIQAPLAFIALCSKQPLPALSETAFFDDETPVIEQFMADDKHFQALRLTNYLSQERIGELSAKLHNLSVHAENLQSALDHKQQALAQQADEIHRLYSVIKAKDDALTAQSTEIRRLNNVIVDKNKALAQTIENYQSSVQELQASQSALINATTLLQALQATWLFRLANWLSPERFPI